MCEEKREEKLIIEKENFKCFYVGNGISFLKSIKNYYYPSLIFPLKIVHKTGKEIEVEVVADVHSIYSTENVIVYRMFFSNGKKIIEQINETFDTNFEEVLSFYTLSLYFESKFTKHYNENLEPLNSIEDFVAREMKVLSEKSLFPLLETFNTPLCIKLYKNENGRKFYIPEKSLIYSRGYLCNWKEKLYNINIKHVKSSANDLVVNMTSDVVINFIRFYSGDYSDRGLYKKSYPEKFYDKGATKILVEGHIVEPLYNLQEETFITDLIYFDYFETALEIPNIVLPNIRQEFKKYLSEKEMFLEEALLLDFINLYEKYDFEKELL